MSCRDLKSVLVLIPVHVSVVECQTFEPCKHLMKADVFRDLSRTMSKRQAWERSGPLPMQAVSWNRLYKSLIELSS